jgi:SNF2 family DNA or RNA helicase
MVDKLDLTAALVVHLFEPQWNPSIEDQALARAHRLGQTRPVTTIRYIMKDSFEEVFHPEPEWKPQSDVTRAHLTDTRS